MTLWIIVFGKPINEKRNGPPCNQLTVFFAIIPVSPHFDSYSSSLILIIKIIIIIIIIVCKEKCPNLL